MQEITDFTRSLGFKCRAPLAIFFDLALEQPEKTINELADLQININNLQKLIPSSMQYSVLSILFPVLKDIVGYAGITIDPLPTTQEVLQRIIERGRKFYQLFGWSEEQILKRSAIIACSEIVVGTVLYHEIPNSIMVYTPTMLERAQLYKDLAIIFPKNAGS